MRVRFLLFVPDENPVSKCVLANRMRKSDEPKGKKGGKVVARLMEELESGDGPVKLKRSGKTCKVTAPFVGVVSFPCDGDKD